MVGSPINTSDHKTIIAHPVTNLLNLCNDHSSYIEVTDYRKSFMFDFLNNLRAKDWGKLTSLTNINEMINILNSYFWHDRVIFMSQKALVNAKHHRIA